MTRSRKQPKPRSKDERRSPSILLQDLPLVLIERLDERVKDAHSRFVRDQQPSPEQLAQADQIARSRGSSAATEYLRDCRRAARRSRPPSRTSVVLDILRTALGLPTEAEEAAGQVA